MKGKMKTVAPTPQVMAFVNDLKAVIQKHPHLDAVEMLAGASQLVGNLIALQDHRTMTNEDAMDIVGANIEAGNLEAIKSVLPSGKRE